MKQRTSKTSAGSKKNGYQVWHFALAVPAIAVTLQVMLGSLTPLPKEHNPYTTRYASGLPGQFNHYGDYIRNEYHQQGLPEFEILPLHLRGDMTGPVLASVIETYFPESTQQHAADLRNAMPPSDDPRMIVILPKEDETKPVF